MRTVELDRFRPALHEAVKRRAVEQRDRVVTLGLRDYYLLRAANHAVSAQEEYERRPTPTLDMMRSWTAAATGGQYVSDEIQAEREATCMMCDYARFDASGPWCGRCGCGVGGELRRIRNMAAYEEKLDPTVTVRVMGVEIGKGMTWGCKHPSRGRAQGEGWKR